MSCEVKNCVFEVNKKNHQNPLPKILISPMKISESGEKYARINHLYKYVGGFSRERENTNRFLQICSVLLHKMLTDGLEWCGLLWIIVMLLSAVWTLILTAPIHIQQRIHWWASDGMLHFSKSVPMDSRWVNFIVWLNHSNMPICSTKLACYRCDH